MITNIKLEGNRFIAFATNDGNEETMAFMPEVIGEDIKAWDRERATYYRELREKEALLKEELIEKQLLEE